MHLCLKMCQSGAQSYFFFPAASFQANPALSRPGSCVSHLNTSRAWPLSGDVSLKKGTTRDRLALRRDAPVPPLALSATPPTKPPARVSAVVCFLRNFSRGFIPAGMVGRWVRVGGCVVAGRKITDAAGGR